MSRIAKAAAVAVGTGAVVVSGAGLALADAGAQSAAVGSPGVVSGNVIQVPIHIPVNVCGNTVDIIALLNPAFGNACVNDGGKEAPGKPGNPGPGHNGGHGNGGYGKDGGYGN
ncbi:chaplin [Streptomyces sp. P10-4]|uniref:chaplin n=1 Tax=Streptomyces sp. P10-4 TaxID=3421645 RepID=UPI003D2E0E16